ncbi:hypothetical protein PHET_09036 [Paragonimus heterotremus]|uniref:Sodium-bile acid cotransporter n=1 Tax=Paragonimus heterotremus TaxID=100268 RepID=A0A8J4WF87_9TREM|nr:hypothetical protein PHET_09036 [Paragonimus heterotremus]
MLGWLTTVSGLCQLGTNEKEEEIRTPRLTKFKRSMEDQQHLIQPKTTFHAKCTINILFVIIHTCNAIHSRQPLMGKDQSAVIDCSVEYEIEMPEKPVRYYGEDTGFYYPQLPVLIVGMYQWVGLKCSCCCDQENIKRAAASVFATQMSFVQNQTTEMNMSEPSGELYYQIVSSNGHVAVPTTAKESHHHNRGNYVTSNENLLKSVDCDKPHACVESYTKVECMSANQNDTVNKPVIQGFYIYADNLGRSKVKASLIWVDKSQENSGLSVPGWTDVFDQAEEQNSKIHVSTQMNEYPRWLITDAKIFVNKQRPSFDENRKLQGNLSQKYNKTTEGRWEHQIQVTIILRPQKFYLASDWSAAIIAFMISLSVGCCNDPVMLRLHVKRPKELLAGIFCQLLIIPGLALLVGVCFQLDVDQAFGLFLTATVPGGGLAYLLTYLVHGDRHLSASLSFIVSWIDIVVSPIWISTVGWFWFNRPLHTGKSVGWLSIIAFAQTLGMVMRGCRPGVAHAVLTWVTRPLLLLSGILMVTLGVYINHYAVNEINQNLILSLLFLITMGFVLGWTAGQLTRQGMPVTKTLATESAVFNGLLCMPLLRTCLHAPEGDLAAVVSLWAIFLAPIPLVYHAIVSLVKGWLTGYLQRQKKNEQQNVISTILVTAGSVPPGDISVASVAAVAAAAIAVAPAITARPRGATTSTEATTCSTEDTNSKQQHSATKINYSSPDCMYASQTQPKSIVKENSFAPDYIMSTANETDSHRYAFFHEFKQPTARDVQLEDRKSDYRQSRQATVIHVASDHAIQEIESIPGLLMDFTGGAVAMRPIRHKGQAPCSSLDPELQADEMPAVITKMDEKSITEKPRSRIVMKKREQQPPLPYTNL